MKKGEFGIIFLISILIFISVFISEVDGYQNPLIEGAASFFIFIPFLAIYILTKKV